MAIRDGDAGDNSLRGTNKSDVLNGFGGNDTLDAVSIKPGTAFDIVDGGNGNDVLNIDATSETQLVTLLSGSTPSFALRTVSGRFTLDAFSIERINIATGSADDFIWTGSRPGSVSGRLGIDHWTADLSALTGDVFFAVGRTNDIVESGFSLRVDSIERITLTTGSGNDRLFGASQGDTIDGGDGNDSISAGTRPSIAGAPVDILVGGDGFDRLVVDAQTETEAVRLLFGANPSFTVRSDSGNFAVDAFEFEEVFFKGGNGDDFIQTGTRGGIINGGGGVNFWNADVSALTSRVDVNLNSGHVFIPAAGLTQVSAIDGLSLSTGSGNDRIVTLIGKAPGRTPIADVVNTGAGNDVINVGMRDPNALPIDIVDGGSGRDILVVDAHGERATVELFAGANPRFTVRSDSGRFAIDAHNIESIDITTGLGDDVLRGNDADDIMDSRSGDDILNGGDGDDTLNAGTGADTIVGGLGADEIDDGGDSGNPSGNTYIYTSIQESSRNRPDRLSDFTAPDRDVLDLSAIDANGAKVGNGVFDFIDDAAFSGKSGELRAVRGRVEADVNGDGVADFRILLTNGAHASADEIIL